MQLMKEVRFGVFCGVAVVCLNWKCDKEVSVNNDPFTWNQV